MNCKFLARDNRCSMRGTALTSGKTFKRDLASYPCFASAFRFINRYPNELYKIYYNLHIRKKCDGVRNNFALIDKINMKKFLKSFTELIPFTFYIKESETDYIVHMELTGTGVQHKGLLMLSRCLFQFPHNLCGYDAIKMQEIGIINDIDCSTIPLYYLYLVGIASTHAPGVECFISRRDIKLLPINELRKKLKSKRRINVNSIIPGNRKKRTCITTINDTDSVEDVEWFNERVDIYLNNYRLSIE